MAVWLIRAGRHGEYEAMSIEEGVTAIGFGLARSVEEFETREALRAELPPASADQLWRFRHEVQPGDMVVLPCKHTRAVAVGRVAGEYAYRPDLSAQASHTRAVDWCATDVQPRHVSRRTRFAGEFGWLHQAGARPERPIVLQNPPVGAGRSGAAAARNLRGTSGGHPHRRAAARPKSAGRGKRRVNGRGVARAVLCWRKPVGASTWRNSKHVAFDRGFLRAGRDRQALHSARLAVRAHHGGEFRRIAGGVGAGAPCRARWSLPRKLCACFGIGTSDTEHVLATSTCTRARRQRRSASQTKSGCHGDRASGLVGA